MENESEITRNNRTCACYCLVYMLCFWLIFSTTNFKSSYHPFGCICAVVRCHICACFKRVSTSEQCRFGCRLSVAMSLAMRVTQTSFRASTTYTKLERANEGGDGNGDEEMRWKLYMQTCMLFSFALLFSFSPFNSSIRRLHLLHYNKLHQDKTQIQLALSCLASPRLKRKSETAFEDTTHERRREIECLPKSERAYFPTISINDKEMNENLPSQRKIGKNSWTAKA